MKKLTTLALMLCMVLAGASCYAQQLDLIPYHYVNYSSIQLENLMQQHDGDLVTNFTVGIVGANPYYDPPTYLGNLLYKVSPHTLSFTDSLFVADALSPFYLFDKDPRGEGNVRVNIELDGEGGINLRIAHFTDDNLAIDPAQDVVVPLHDREICGSVGYEESYMIDCRGDLIVKYYIPSTDSIPCEQLPSSLYEGHIARYGLDGTLKHEALLPSNQNFITHFGVFSEQPLKYYHWNGYSNLHLYVLDSLFQQKNYYVINKDYFPGSEHYTFSNSHETPTFVIPDGNDLLLATRYVHDSAGVIPYNLIEHGAAVARYDLRTMQRKAFIQFNDLPGPNSYVTCMCFKKSSVGNLYFVYSEDTYGTNEAKKITVVKMDPDLNVLWTRYCSPMDYATKADIGVGWYSVMSEDEEGVKIEFVGYSQLLDTPDDNGIYYFFLTDDDPSGTDEGEIKIRPYAFWPNPVQDRLILKFSPDVQPQTIELYDLQGRLVRSQTTSFESLSMVGLAAGQYVLKVTLENGKVYTDKVVKE